MVQDFFRAANAMFGRCKVCKYVPCILDVVSRIFANICIHIYTWRFSLMEISHSCRCLPISCLNRWILSANLLELLEPLLFWPFLFCGVCARCGTLETSSEQCKPKKTTETTRKTPANFRKTHANTRKNPQIRKRRFLDFLNVMKTWSSLPFMCEMVLKSLKWHGMTWNSWNYWNYWKAKTTGNFLEDESPGIYYSCINLPKLFINQDHCANQHITFYCIICSLHLLKHCFSKWGWWIRKNVWHAKLR